MKSICLALVLLCGCVTSGEVEPEGDAEALTFCLPDVAARSAVEHRFDEICVHSRPSDQLGQGNYVCRDWRNVVTHELIPWTGPRVAGTLKADVLVCFDNGACYLQAMLDCGCNSCRWSS